MVSRGGIAPFDGDLDDYQRYLLEESKRLRAEAVAAAATLDTRIASPIKLAVTASQQSKLEQEKKRPLQKELEKVEPKLAALEVEKELMIQKLLEPLNPQEIAENAKRLKIIDQELAALETRWLEINEALASN
jgi:ATP-binding cassette subfamily F protein 3